MLPLALFAAFSVLAVVESDRAAEEVRLRDIGQALAAAVDERLASSFLALRVLASSSLLDATPLDAAAFEEHSRRVGEDTGGWVVLLGPPPDYVTLVNPRRHPGASFPPLRPPEVSTVIEEPLRVVFEQQRTAVSNLFRGPFVERLVLAAFVPVIRDARVTYALSVTLEPSRFRTLLLDQGLRDGVFAFVLDGNHRIVAHSLATDGPPMGTAVPAWMAAELQGANPRVLVGRGLLGTDNVYAFARLDLAPGWRVAIAQPVEMVNAAAWRSARWLPLGGVALALGTAILVWASRREALRDAHREAAALRAGRAEIARLFGGLPAVVFLRAVAPDGGTRLLYRDGDLARVTGWPASTFAGVDSLRPWVDLEPADYHAFLARVLRDGAATIEYRMRQPDGSWRQLRAHARLLAHRPDGTAEVVGYVLDITAERSAEARAVAAARLASLGEMAAGLAHELKQPLQSISLAAEVARLALARSDPVAADRRLARIVEQTGRASEVIEHLRRFARGTDDGAPITAVSLSMVVGGALGLTGATLRDASISVEVALGDPPPVVRGQAVLLEQVLSNLLLNASDALAARPPGAPRRIRIAAAPGPDGMVRLTVADTGGGIASEVLARLFEPFVTTKGPDKGTGLGLSISHGLVTSMGGRIEAHNNAEGAVFSITLQAATAGETAAERRQQVANISAGPSGSETPMLPAVPTE